MLGEKEAEELTQEVFVKVDKALKDFDQLPEDYQAILVLREAEGFKNCEITVSPQTPTTIVPVAVH